jgi:putative ABC transport system substrate-binding protein
MKRSISQGYSLDYNFFKRLIFLITVFGMFLFPFNLAYSFTVAVVKSQNLGPYDRAVEGFKESTSNHVVEFVLKSGVEEANETVAREIERIRPELIFAVGVKAAVFSKSTLGRYPLVFAMVINPEKYQLTGKNIVGIPLEVPPEEQFKLLKEVIPSLRRIGIIFDPNISGELVTRAKEEAKDLGLSVKLLGIHNRNEVPNAIRQMKDQVDAVWMVPDSTVYSEESLPFIFTYTLDEKIPFMAFSESFVDAGALLSLSPDYKEVGQQASFKVDELLGGKVQNRGHLLKHRLVLNLKSAKKLNIEIPKLILDVASRIVD